MYADKSIYTEKALFLILLLPVLPLRSDSERQPVMSMIAWLGRRRRSGLVFAVFYVVGHGLLVIYKRNTNNIDHCN